MDNLHLQWIITSLIGVVVTFGGIILAAVRKDIDKTEQAIKDLQRRFEEIKLPNVGVSMCEEIQEKYEAKHEVIEKAFGHYERKCEDLEARARQNRETLLEFRGKLDLILQKVDAIAK